MDGMVFDEDGEKAVPQGREQISALDAHWKDPKYARAIFPGLQFKLRWPCILTTYFLG
jgi:hypothetical protein